MLNVELPDKRKRGRQMRRFRNVLKMVMRELNVTEKAAEDSRRKRVIRCDDP